MTVITTFDLRDSLIPWALRAATSARNTMAAGIAGTSMNVAR